jgi:hypothetical protein
MPVLPGAANLDREGRDSMLRAMSSRQYGIQLGVRFVVEIPDQKPQRPAATLEQSLEDFSDLSVRWRSPRAVCLE